jgi:GWxTD domain-containing protein
MKKVNYKKTVTTLMFLAALLNSNAQKLDAYFYHAPFFAPGIGTYVETYIAIPGNSAVYKTSSDSLLIATINVAMMFKNGDELKEFRKYSFISPAITDTSKAFPSFIDLQRIPIAEGVYNFKLFLTDDNALDKTGPTVINDIITINIPADHLGFSGIQFIEKYTSVTTENIFVKHGYECIPYVSDYFGAGLNNLRFYFELYNIDLEIGGGEDFLVNFYIHDFYANAPIAEFSSFQKHQAKNINPVFKTIDIAKLPTGNYYLVIEVRNRQNQTLGSTRRFFQRYNPTAAPLASNYTTVNTQHTFVEQFTNPDSLAFLLKALAPIANAEEKRHIDNYIKTQETGAMQKFFLAFWTKRNEQKPQLAWEQYRQQLIIVQEKYGSKHTPGFDTDRGRIYLQYGAPNSIIEEPAESNAYPYEIWHYYKIADLSNKKFLFYNKSLTDNNYTLLYSNMATEAINPYWLSELYSRTNMGTASLTNKKPKAQEYLERE